MCCGGVVGSGFGLNCVSPNSYVDALTSNVIAFGDGVLGRQLELDELMRVGL